MVTESEIRELPNLTRNAYQFVALAGNVSDAGMGTRGAGFSINGQRESSTNILLDGASNNDEFTSGIGQQVPLDAVQEFSVLTSNFTAEYGRASGGIVNVVTKSGTNNFHGTAYEFNRVSNFSSNSFQNNANGPAEIGLHAQPVRLLVRRPDHEEQAVLLQQHGVDPGAQRGDELRLGADRGPDRADAREHAELLPDAMASCAAAPM